MCAETNKQRSSCGVEKESEGGNMFSVMTKVLVATSVSLALAFVAAGAALAGHPSDPYETKPLPESYGTVYYGTSPDESFDDIQFTRPFPDPATLDHAERYMLAGLNNFQGEIGRASWYDDIMRYVTAYYDHHQSVPPVLTEEVIRSVCANAEECTSADFDWYRSPIHGGWPRLDAREFSPGDLYVKVLSESEIDRLCVNDKILEALVKRGEATNPGTGVTSSVHLWSPVIYVRMYGRNGVILSGIHVTFGENK